MLCTSATRARTSRRSHPNQIRVSWLGLVSFTNTFSKLHKERAYAPNFHFMETMLLEPLSVWLWPNQCAGTARTGLSSSVVDLSIGQRRGNDSSDGVCIFPVFFFFPLLSDVTFVSYKGPFLCVGSTNIVKGFKSPSVGFTVRFKYVRVAFGIQRMSQWRKAGEKTALPSVSRRVIPFLPLWRVLLHLVWLPVYVKIFYSPFIQFHPTTHTAYREQPRKRSSAVCRDHGKKQSRRQR